MDPAGRFTLAQGEGTASPFECGPNILGQSVFEVCRSYPEIIQLVKTGLEGEARNQTMEIEGALWDMHIYPVLDQRKSLTSVVWAAIDVTHDRKTIWAHRVIVELSSALRQVHTRKEMAEILVNYLQQDLQADRVALAVFGPGGKKGIEIQAASGKWHSVAGKTFTSSDQHWLAELSFNIRESGRNALSIHIKEVDQAERPIDTTIMGIALQTDQEQVGVFWIGRETPFRKAESRVLVEIGVLIANAFQREAQHEHMKKRLSRLTALRNIDRAITSSFNLEVTFNVLLTQVLSELEVDAVDVFQYNPGTYHFEFVAGRGFQAENWNNFRFNEGEGLVGWVARDRSMVIIPDMVEKEDVIVRKILVEEEGFTQYFGIPLLAKGELKGVMEVFKRKPFIPEEEWLDFYEALATQAAIALDNANLIDHVRRFDMELDLVYNATLEGWVRALDLRDKETEGHTQRVTKRTIQLARAMGIQAEKLIHIRRGALLHDIGKLGIPDHILNKPGPLSSEEWDLMKKHPEYAKEMLSQIDFLQPALDIPYCHHEKWDGTGYPRGLKETRIPLAARIFALVDVWDALMSNRPYRRAWPEEKVYHHILSQAGLHFDPQVVKAWREVFDI